MKITPRSVTISELILNYEDSGNEGVVALGGKLNVRPAYQREFVYGEEQRKAVIDTVMNGFPLNVMYWADLGNGTYEVIDGQQRSISICQFANSVFSHKELFFHNLTDDQREKFLNYELQVYECAGESSEKLAWFETINIAGVTLSNQELRNAVYSGPWTADAKRYFSRPGCPAQDLASKYVSGSSIRQDYLETAISWISKGEINDYMGRHQHESSAAELWLYFQNVIEWVKVAFPHYRREMKGLAWGPLFDQYRAEGESDPQGMESHVAKLMLDDEITNKRGIYTYVFDKKEKHLNLRTFSEAQKREAYERQGGICSICGKEFEFEKMQGDHIVPWSKNGKTSSENCQMLCAEDNNRKRDN